MLDIRIKWRPLALLVLAVSTLSIIALFNFSVRDDLIRYVNKAQLQLMQRQGAMEESYIKKIGSNYHDDAAIITQLKEETIPECRSLLQESMDYQPRTEEIQQLHTKWVESLQIRLQAYEILLTSLSTNDFAGIDESNRLHRKAETLYREYQSELTATAAANGVNLHGSNFWSSIKAQHRILIPFVIIGLLPLCVSSFFYFRLPELGRRSRKYKTVLLTIVTFVVFELASIFLLFTGSYASMYIIMLKPYVIIPAIPFTYFAAAFWNGKEPANNDTKRFFTVQLVGLAAECTFVNTYFFMQPAWQDIAEQIAFTMSFLGIVRLVAS